MTPQDLREKRLNILEAMLLELSPSQVMLVTESEEWLDRLEALDKEYIASQRNPWHDFVIQAESLLREVKQHEGRPLDMHGPIDALVSHLIRYKASLPTEEAK